MRKTGRGVNGPEHRTRSQFDLDIMFRVTRQVRSQLATIYVPQVIQALVKKGLKEAKVMMALDLTQAQVTSDSHSDCRSIAITTVNFTNGDILPLKSILAIANEETTYGFNEQKRQCTARVLDWVILNLPEYVLSGQPTSPFRPT
eukprot:8562253-Pyramimonas_sp.AAC.1